MLEQRPQDSSKPDDASAATVQVTQPEPPQTLQIDFTPKLYEEIKAGLIKKQHSLVRPYLLDFINWLKKLNPIDVYDALEKGESIRTFYDRQRFSPYRIGAAAARGLLKSSKRLREKSGEAFNIQTARLVLRFENREVHDLIREFDPQETYLKTNIDDLKRILGLLEEAK